ncbi:hypothetical protein Bca101_008804 [Brassica carinata]
MTSGAGDGVSRRRWASLMTMLLSFTCLFLFCCLVCWLPVCFSWPIKGERSRRTLLRRRECRLFIALFPTVFALQMASPPATSREGSLTAALLWSSVSTPVDPLSGCRRTSHAVDSVYARQTPLELRSQPMSSTSPSPVRFEPKKTPGFAPPHLTGARSQRASRLKPSYFGSFSIVPSLKVMLLPPMGILFDGGSSPLRRSSPGDLSFGTVGRLTSDVPRPTLPEVNGLLLSFAWAWPIGETISVSPITLLPRPMLLERNPSQIVKILGDWGILYENSGGFTGISFRCLMSHFSFGMLLPVVSSGLVLFRSLSSLEDKTVSPRALPMARDVSSDSWSSVCFSFFISLSSCVAVSTGPEDAIEITSVVLVDEGWTSTSHYVTILQLSDSVEDFVLCPLSSSVEDLSCLAYLYVVVYAYCQRGWLIPSFYCIEEV